LNLTDYQALAGETAIYPDRHSKTGLMYVALGLASEAGEVAGKVKKYYRDGALDKQALGSEVADCLWYLSQLADELDLDLGDLAKENILKLQSRKERNVLGGSGDNR